MREYLRAFAWPFRPSNLTGLGLGIAVAVLVPGTLGLLPAATIWWGWPLFIAVAGTYAVFLRDVLENAMAGRDRLPPWPCEDLFELHKEFFSVLGPFVAAFAPLAILTVASGPWRFELWDPLPSLTQIIGGPLATDFSRESRTFLVAVVGLWLLGWLALPILLLAWPFGGFRSLFHPLTLVGAAVRTGGEYLAVSLLTAGLFVGAWSVTRLPVPRGLELLNSYRAYGVSFLALVIAARIVGVCYRRNREAMGWERISAPETPAPASRDVEAVG